MKSRDEIMRADKKFKKELNDMKISRIKNGVDKEFRSDREMTELMLKAPSFKDVKKELSTFPRKEDLK